MLDEDYTKPFDIENASGCFFMIRTELFRKIGGFDEGYFLYFEDSDITRTVRKYARVVFDPSVVVYHEWERSRNTTSSSCSSISARCSTI